MWTYCVQYRETDFNFVSRLMEQEGIYYYFKHTKTDHVLVLCDKAQHYDDSGKEIEYQYSYASGGHEKGCRHPLGPSVPIRARRLRPDRLQFRRTAARGAISIPTQPLLSTKPAKGKAKQFPNAAKHEIFDYPGEYEKKSDGDTCTERYIEEEEVACDVANGSGTCASFFSPGVKFKFEVRPGRFGCHEEEGRGRECRLRPPVGSAFGRRTTSTGGSQTYSNSFTCIPADVNFRPARITRKPSIQGVQTAVVVGPSGSEINTDKFGRVQVQFFWDRYGTRSQGKEEKPIWIRVGQIIAGKNWGAMFIPRVGQEVHRFVSRRRSRLAAGHRRRFTMPTRCPPTPCPTKRPRATSRRTPRPGGDGYNELRFEDKKGSEQIFIHAATQHGYAGQKRFAASGSSATATRSSAGKRTAARRATNGKWSTATSTSRSTRNQVEQIGDSMQLLIGGIDSGQGNQDIVLREPKRS